MVVISRMEEEKLLESVPFTILGFLRIFMQMGCGDKRFMMMDDTVEEWVTGEMMEERALRMDLCMVTISNRILNNVKSSNNFEEDCKMIFFISKNPTVSEMYFLLLSQ